MAQRMILGDWRPYRKAIDAAYERIGEPLQSNIPERDWNFACAVVAAFPDVTKTKCVNCKNDLAWHQAIRCLDCKSSLCETCAPRHLWPNGRPKAPDHKG